MPMPSTPTKYEMPACRQPVQLLDELKRRPERVVGQVHQQRQHQRRKAHRSGGPPDRVLGPGRQKGDHHTARQDHRPGQAEIGHAFRQGYQWKQRYLPKAVFVVALSFRASPSVWLASPHQSRQRARNLQPSMRPDSLRSLARPGKSISLNFRIALGMTDTHSQAPAKKRATASAVWLAISISGSGYTPISSSSSQQRQQHGPLAPIDIRQRAQPRVDRAGEQSLVHQQQRQRRNHQADHTHDRPKRQPRPGAAENKELAHEAGHARQAKVGEHRDAHQAGEHRDHRAQAAVGRQLVRAAALGQMRRPKRTGRWCSGRARPSAPSRR